MKPTNDVSHIKRLAAPEDAIGMLIADHKRVASLFAQYRLLKETGRSEQKTRVVSQICKELTIHTTLEEELFYPAVRKATSDNDQMDEALIEHAGAKQLISQLEAADPDDDLYDAKVTVLGEQIDHHVLEEEGSMFPKARYSGLDTHTLGAAMDKRRLELLSVAAKDDVPRVAHARADTTVKKPPAPSDRAASKQKATKSMKRRQL